MVTTCWATACATWPTEVWNDIDACDEQRTQAHEEQVVRENLFKVLTEDRSQDKFKAGPTAVNYPATRVLGKH